MAVKTNIMLIIPEMSVGGAQRSLAKLSVEFAVSYTVYLVVFNNKDDVAYTVGGTVLSLDVHPGLTMIAKVAAFWKRAKKLRKLKKQLNISVSISFLEGADYVNVLSKQNDKVILSIRGSKLHDENMLNYFFWLRSNVLIPWLYRKADYIISVNEGITRELKKHHRILASRISTIGNFYDREEILRLSSETRDDTMEKYYRKEVLITTGRLSAEKGIDGVIKTFAQLRKKRDGVTLIVVGDGPDRDKLLLLCAALSLRVARIDSPIEDADVVFAGNQRNVFKYLRGASIYLMNSSSEGFPNGLVEAMICGVPVISSNCPYGPGEILTPDLDQDSWNGKPHFSNYGVLMPIAETGESIDLWVSTLNDVLNDASLRQTLASQGAERTRDFDKSQIIKRWLEIIGRDTVI